MASSISKFSSKQPLGRALVKSGQLTETQLNQALVHKLNHGGKLGQVLVKLGFIEESQLVDALRNQGRISSIHLSPSIVNIAVAKELGEELSRKHSVIAINRIAGYMTVAMEDPQDVHAIDRLKREVGEAIYSVYADQNSIDEALDFAFGEAAGGGLQGRSQMSLQNFLGNVEASGASLELEARDDLAESLEENEDDQPIINLVRAVLLEGFQEGASDIHIEPQREQYVIRYRVDGTCFEKTRVPKAWGARMMVRLKLLADLGISQRRLPQDGRSQIQVGKQRVDLRVTTTPTVEGEGAVIRILDGGREMKDLTALGLREEQLEKLRRIVRCQEGFVLATGPTGSGKTTTLYGILKGLSTEENKVITLEDPVENVLEGVTQISTHAKIGLTFAKGLRSILRQDPDVILVGEIRDQETAGIAIEASMTGHIVLSTLHTVGSCESISRLMDLGVESYLIGDTLQGVIAQRLLRKICSHCRVEKVPEAAVLEELGINAVGTKFYEGEGCSQCRNLGFKGRVGIYEILVVDSEMRGLIQNQASKDELLLAARAAGLSTLREEGLRMARTGEVTLADVLAVTN